LLQNVSKCLELGLILWLRTGSSGWLLWAW